MTSPTPLPGAGGPTGVAASGGGTPVPSPMPASVVPDGPVATIDLPTPRIALAIVAHPDDAEFLCGATFAKWAARGCVLNHLVLTDGSKGTWDPDADVDDLIEQRRGEQMEAASRLGSQGKVVMLEHVDGELQPTLHVRDQVAYWIRAIRPDVILCHDPWKRYRLHPDHRNAGWLALDGLVAARDPHFFRHHDVPFHRPESVLLFEADEPDHVEDVSGYVEAKVDALLAHRSQYVTTHGIPEDDDGTATEAFRQKVLAHAALVGARTGVGAGEAFKAMTEL